MHEHVAYRGRALQVLQRLRRTCLAYPEAHEVEQFGHPWFKAGKRPFVVFGHQRDDPQIAFATTRDDQDALCRLDPRFVPTPYMHQHGWVSLRLSDGPRDADWAMIEELVETAYRNVALQRMLKALAERRA